MATTTTQDRASGPDPSNRRQILGSLESPESTRMGAPRKRLLAGVGILIGVGVAAAASTQLPALIGSEDGSRILTHKVTRGDLVITVTESGNVESASNKDLKSEVEGGSTILSIVEDGTQVKEGDELVRLDSSNLEAQVNTQKITVEKARAVKIQAEQDFEVAKIAIQEYLEGTFEQELQVVEGNITIALENLRSAENALEYTKRMTRKGYATQLQLEAQEFAVERSKLDLAVAETAKTVLEKFTKVKMLKDLEAQRDAAEARSLSEKAAFELEEGNLKRLTAQLEKCVLYAPQDGMVIYANDMMRRFGSGTSQIEEGATVRERQTIIRLPDLSRMQVKVTVHESKVDSISRGMRAGITIQDQEFQGTVTRIGNQPERSGWMSANVKEYATTVKIEGDHANLKPGMTAEVEILIDHLKDVISVPVQAVVEQGGKFYCWAKTPAGPERRPLLLGASDDKFIEIKDGLLEGDEVLLNPRALVAEAREEEEVEAEAVDLNKKFGAASPTDRAADLREPGDSTPLDARRSEESATPSSGERKRGDASGGRGRSGRSFDLMQYDTDSDGKVSREEAPERMQRFFDRLDANSDGFIDAAEISAMRSRPRQGGSRGGRGSGEPGGRRGEGGSRGGQGSGEPGGQRGRGEGAGP